MVGLSEGKGVGRFVGTLVGLFEGKGVGNDVGSAVGTLEGKGVGAFVSLDEASVLVVVVQGDIHASFSRHIQLPSIHSH